MSNDRKSWEVKNEKVCAELIEFLALTPQECALLQSLEGAARNVAGTMVTEFHGRIMSTENTKQYFENTDIHRVGAMVNAWFVELFSGNYDAAYALKRIKIGQTHVRIGLPVRYPLAMLEIVGRHAEAIFPQAADPAAARLAFHKVLSIDVAVFNQAYEDAQLKHLSDLVGGEKLARLLMSS